MDWKRFWRHVVMTPLAARRAFPASTLEAIQRAVGEQEKRHRGEIRFVVEAELTTPQLHAGLTPRQRATELFAQLGVWDTAERTGVLVYVLLADHAVEIVAIPLRVPQSETDPVVAAGSLVQQHSHGAVDLADD